MDSPDAIDLGREALWAAVRLAGPLLLAALLAAVASSFFQTVLQIQDPALSFVPKLLAVLATCAVCLPWLLEQLVEYTRTLVSEIPQTLTGG